MTCSIAQKTIAQQRSNQTCSVIEISLGHGMAQKSAPLPLADIAHQWRKTQLRVHPTASALRRQRSASGDAWRRTLVTASSRPNRKGWAVRERQIDLVRRSLALISEISDAVARRAAGTYYCRWIISVWQAHQKPQNQSTLIPILHAIDAHCIQVFDTIAICTRLACVEASAARRKGSKYARNAVRLSGEGCARPAAKRGSIALCHWDCLQKYRSRGWVGRKPPAALDIDIPVLFRDRPLKSWSLVLCHGECVA